MEGSGRITKGRAGGSSRGAGEGCGGLHQPLRGRPLRAAASPGLGSLPGHPPHSPLRPRGGEGAQPGRPSAGSPRDKAAAAAQKPGESPAALATVGISTRRGRGLASITADLPRPPCWEETTRHAAAERLQRRKRRRRRRRRCLPRAAAARGGWGRRAAREERPEPQRYGGPAGPRRLLRSPAGRRGAWRASCGAGHLGAALLGGGGRLVPLLPRGEKDFRVRCFHFPDFLKIPLVEI